ncbi:MAG: N-acetylmuramoyl-L-alanine amidase [bacterium]|nr:N-acetylmuramoyl-L-alanine amidase [Candidatus Colisoma equi]
MTLSAILAAVSIVFPPEGAKLPNLERCYVMGAADAGETVFRVSGFQGSKLAEVKVGRTGAWTTVVDVKPGTNVVEIGETRRMFIVESPDTRRQAPGNRHYPKLEYASDRAKPHPTGKRPEEITVALDAGHGGHDNGAMSPHGLPEKDANLRLAKAVRNELAKRGYKVVMTREDDTFVGLYDRPKVAHAANADLFVSIHHNAPGYAVDPSEVRSQSVYAWNALGEKLAKAVNGRMAAADPSLRNDGVLHANFAVTRNPEIPSCLVEADFITHPDGESAAWDASRRPSIAAAIADGITDWVAAK